MAIITAEHRIQNPEYRIFSPALYGRVFWLKTKTEYTINYAKQSQFQNGQFDISSLTIR
jgi:hypothetical protein